MSGNGKRDIVVVEPPAGGNWSDIEGKRDDGSEGQMPEEVACLIETKHRELEEPSNPKSENPQ